MYICLYFTPSSYNKVMKYISEQRKNIGEQNNTCSRGVIAVSTYIPYKVL